MIGTGGERPSLFTCQPSHEQKSVLPGPSPILSTSVPSSMRRSLTPDMEETLRLKAEKIKKEIDDGDAAEDGRLEKEKEEAKKDADSSDAFKKRRKAIEDKLCSNARKM